ncbi:hypothetical protein Tco_0307697 [Tanacetum coccineum]
MPSYRTLMIREEFNDEEQRLNLDLLQERRDAYARGGFRPGEFGYRRNEESEWRIKGSWDPSGKSITELHKHSRMGSYNVEKTMEER